MLVYPVTQFQKAAAAGGSGFYVGHVRAAANTTTGNQSFTIVWSDGGGHTPTAVEIRVTLATADATAVDHACLCTGAATGTTERWSAFGFSEHGQVTSDTYNFLYTGACIVIPTTAGNAIDGQADFVSFSADTVTINWSNAPASAYLIHVKAYAGTTEALAGTITPSTTNLGTADMTSFAGAANYVFLYGASQGKISETTIRSHAPIPYGYYSYDGVTERQVIMMSGHRDARGTTDIIGRWSDNFIGGELRTAGASLDATYVISNIGTGFRLTSNNIGSTSASLCAYLALRIPSGSEAYVYTGTSPTSTGTKAFTGPGWTPQAVDVIHSMLTMAAASATTDGASDKEKNSPEADGMSWGTAISTSSEYSMNICDYDGQATTSDTQSRTESKVATVCKTTGVVAIAADVSSFDADGLTLNYTTVDATARRVAFVAFKDG